MCYSILLEFCSSKIVIVPALILCFGDTGMDLGFFRGFSDSGSPMTFKGFFEETLGPALLGGVVSFDIETFSPHGFPYNAEDPVVNYSLVVPMREFGLLAISAIGSPEAEADLLRLLSGLLVAFKDSYLLTYNGAKFDLDYVTRRGGLYGLNFEEIFDIQRHVDVYQLVRWLGVRLPCYSQQSVEKALGIKRAVLDVSGRNYCRVYRNFIKYGDLTPLFYNLEDSFGCLRIAKAILRFPRRAKDGMG